MCKEIILWNLHSSTKPSWEVFVKSKRELHKLAFSPDGKHLAAGSYDDFAPRISSFHVNSIDGFTGRIRSVHVGSYDGFAPRTRTVSVWDLSSRNKVAEFNGDSLVHESGGYIKHLCFSPCSKFLAAGHSSGMVYSWSMDSKQKYRTFCENLLGITFLPTGNLISTTSKAISEWSFIVKESQQIHFPCELSIRQVRFSSDMSYFVYYNLATRTFDFRSIASGDVFRSLEYTGDGEILSMDLSPDDQLIAASIWEKEQGCYLGIWDAIKPKEQLHCELGAHGAKAKAIAFSPDGQLLAMGDSSGVLSIWDGDKDSQIEPSLEDRSSNMSSE